MLRSLFAGISGLRVNQTMLDVTGNNIANANTTGYKASTTVFQDTLSQMMAGGTAANAERGGTNEGWENYRQMLLKNYPARTPDVNYEHAARQAYIGLGACLIAAAFEEVDATPMEGFDPKAVDAILGLSARGLRSVVIVPLGYRATEGDWLENLKKVRRPTAQFVTEVK